MFSPASIADFLACRHLGALNRAYKAGRIKKPYFDDPGLELLRRLGVEHDERYLKELIEERGLTVISLPDVANRVTFKITNCDLKESAGSAPQISTVRFYRAWILMLSSVLKSERAVQVNIQIMRAFVRLRELITTNTDFTRRLDELERRHDGQFTVVFKALKHLMAAPPKRKPIGFRAKK
jgi:hypothetical protein